MYQQEDITPEPNGTRPAEDSVEALTEHVLAILRHPLTPEAFYDEVVCGLSLITRGTRALAHPDCVRIIVAAAAEPPRRCGCGRREGARADDCDCDCD